MDERVSKEKNDKPAGDPQQSSVSIPVLPLALGIAALLAGVGLLFVVGASTKKRNIEELGPAPLSSNFANASRMRWIRVEAAPEKILGLADNDAPASMRGFRPKSEIHAPGQTFEIQQHEVTWEELDPYLANNPGQTFIQAPLEVTPEVRKTLAAAGVPWSTARDYCRSLGGSLPTEEQWELAARGSGLNKFPGGNVAPDFSRLQAFKGESAKPTSVMTNDQDRTDGAAEKAIYDLAGNVQEWTSSVWRDDLPGADLSWVNDQDTVVYAIRGFPIYRDPPARVDELSLAYRDWVCATGDCSPLAAGASPRDRARRPKIEFWANADSTEPGALEWRKVIEKNNVVLALTKCFFDRTATKVTLKASKESFCPRIEHVPANGKCGREAAISAPLLSMSGDLSETALKCVNYALHNVSVEHAAASLPETKFSYQLYVETNPMLPRAHIGFRCVREVPQP
jgi:formylglycine-generating enzyme required for sulfatase activity